MTIGAVLVGYAACVGTLGSRMLGRPRWTARAPLLAIVTYLTAGWSDIVGQPRGRCWWSIWSQPPTAWPAGTPR